MKVHRVGRQPVSCQVSRLQDWSNEKCGGKKASSFEQRQRQSLADRHDRLRLLLPRRKRPRSFTISSLLMASLGRYTLAAVVQKQVRSFGADNGLWLASVKIPVE